MGDHSSHGCQLAVLAARSISARTSPRLRSRIATISSISSAVDDQRRAEGDPVRVEPAEQAVCQRPAADLDAEGRRVGKPRLGRPVAHELDRLEQPLAAHVADHRILRRQRLEAGRAAARPASAALASRSRSRISRSTAIPAAHEIGLPSKVCPSTNPGFSAIGPQNASAIGRRQIIAESGA